MKKLISMLKQLLGRPEVASFKSAVSDAAQKAAQDVAASAKKAAEEVAKSAEKAVDEAVVSVKKAAKKPASKKTAKKAK